MGLFKNIKAAREAAKNFNVTGVIPDQNIAAMTPEQRTAYEAQMTAAMQASADAQAQWQAAAAAVAAGQKPTLGGPIPEAPPQLEDDARDQRAAEELAAREQARTTYLSPHRAHVAFTRIAAEGKTQIAEVAAYLGASGLSARPDLVYGVSRVPDRISPTSMRNSEKGGVVEWEVIHAATTSLSAGAPAAVASFGAQETWVARLPGEPSVLDEDVALAYLAYAEIPPEQSLGIARHLAINKHNEEDGPDYMVSQVTGVHVFHAPGLGGGVYERMEGNAPLRLGVGAPEGFHVELLDWRAIADIVHPQSHKPSLVPSPCPHLPGTPQELLRAYLEIVGVQPAHCYSAQVTEAVANDIQGRGKAGWFSTSTNVGSKQLCADGKERRRLFGGSQIVIVYRDDPAYATGRERWASYQRDVLLGDLSDAQSARRPVERLDILDRLPGGVRGVVKTANWFISDGDPWDKIPPHRYCWPPQQSA